MRTVKNRKELIAGIKAGEREFNVEGDSLLLQCKLASMFNGRNATKSAIAAAAPMAAVQCGIISEGTIIALTAMAIVGAIAIIAVVKGRNLEIEVDEKGKGRLRVF